MSDMVPMYGFGGGGGGAALNFSIVGGTEQPANPKENTIWVNTDVEIAQAIIGKFPNPNWAMQNGTVLINAVTGDASGGDFNALKKGYIWLKPLSVSQYASGAWVAKTAKIYQNSAWTVISSRVDYISNGGVLIKPVSSYNVTLKQTGTNYKISAAAGAKPAAVNFECNNIAGRTVNITVTSAKVYPAQSTYYSGVLVNTAQTEGTSNPAYVALTKMPTSDTSTTYTLKIPDSFNSGYLTIFFQTYGTYETYYNIKDMWIE